MNNNMTKLKEKAAEYSFNIPSKIYQSCKTQEEMKLWKDEIECAYIQAYNQAMQDFTEKACEWLEKELLVSDIEHQKYWIITEENKSNFIKDFKNYMQDESEN